MDSERTYSVFDEALVVVAIIAFTILLVVVTQGIRSDHDMLEQISRDLCENNSFIYKRIESTDKIVVCETNITQIGQHYNISPAPVEVRIKPDWGYYLKKESGTK